jgi:hypothetical protein
MDTSPNTDFSNFLDFCKSLDVGSVHSPEQALELFRSDDNGAAAVKPGTGALGRDLLDLRQQIIASGLPLLDENELDLEVSQRRGEQLGKD